MEVQKRTGKDVEGQTRMMYRTDEEGHRTGNDVEGQRWTRKDG